jgi:hypothetical protein
MVIALKMAHRVICTSSALLLIVVSTDILRLTRYVCNAPHYATNVQIQHHAPHAQNFLLGIRIRKHANANRTLFNSTGNVYLLA